MAALSRILGDNDTVGCLIVITPLFFFKGGVNLPIIIFGNL